MNLTRMFMILIPLLMAFFGASCLSISLFLLFTGEPARKKFFHMGLKSIALAILLAMVFYTISQ